MKPFPHSLKRNRTGNIAIAAVIILILLLAGGAYYFVLHAPATGDKPGIITSTPVTSALVGHQYEYDFTSNVSYTLILVSSNPSMIWSAGTLGYSPFTSGYVECTPGGPGSYAVSIELRTSIGNAYQNYTLTVS
jgi:hypothetical protein